MKISMLALALAILGSAPSAWAATVEVMPMVGFQLNGSRDLAGPRNDRLDLKNAALRGLSIGYLNKEDGELELSWTRAYSAAEIQRSGGAPPDRFDVRIEQIHLNGLYMFDPAPLQPFLLVGVGATRYTPAGDLSTATRFSFAIGGGLKWLWNDHIGLRFDGRWTPSVAFRGSHFFCDESNGGGCYSIEPNSLLAQYPFLHTFEFTSGLLLRY